MKSTNPATPLHDIKTRLSFEELMKKLGYFRFKEVHPRIEGKLKKIWNSSNLFCF